MKKILRAMYFSITGILFSIIIFNQLAVASPFPGDEAIVAGNMTLDLALSQPPAVEMNESITTNSSIADNNTNQTNQTILMTMNKT